MKYSNIIIISFVFLVIGCNAATQDNNIVNEQPITLKANGDNFNGFCVITSTSDLEGKNRFAEADDEFLMLDELFSNPISCNNNYDCYEFLLDQDEYKSMAPEYEPYLNCESESIAEINFKKN